MWLLAIIFGIFCVGLVISLIVVSVYYFRHLSQYQALTNDLKLLETTKNKLDNQVSTLQSSIQNLTTEEAKLTGALEVGRRELESLVAQKATYELDGCLIEQMASKRGNEEELLRDVELRLKEAASHLDDLRTQCLTQTEQLDAAKSELVDAQKQKELFLKELEKVQFELDAAKNA
jgi:chromosome segregation ATPase